MKKNKQIKNRIKDYFFDSSIYIKDRTFVLFTVCMLSALVAYSSIRIFFDHDISMLCFSAVAFLISLGVIYILAKKRTFHAAKIIMALVLVLGLRPAAFFVSGGIHNGEAF